MVGKSKLNVGQRGDFDHAHSNLEVMETLNSITKSPLSQINPESQGLSEICLCF